MPPSCRLGMSGDALCCGGGDGSCADVHRTTENPAKVIAVTAANAITIGVSAPLLCDRRNSRRPFRDDVEPIAFSL